jgi:hypothetical protein
MSRVPALLLATGSAAAAAAAYASTAGDATNATSYTFAGQGIGTASGDRYVVVCYALQQSGGGAPVDPTITVGGAACTSLVTVTDATAERYGIHITSAVFTSGTTADIIVNEGSTQHSCEIYVFAVTGLNSITPTDTASSTASPPSDTINCDAGGVIIGVAGTAVDASSFTWVGITERADSSVADTFTASAASGDFATAQTGLTITATPASSTRPHMAAVALR